MTQPASATVDMEYAVAYCADIQCAVGSFGHSVYAAELQFAVYFGTQSARKAILTRK